MRDEIAGRPLLAASLALIAGISAAWHWWNALFLVLLLAVCMKRLPAAIWVAAAFLVGLAVAPPQTPLSIVRQGTLEGAFHVADVPSLTPNGEACTIQGEAGRYRLSIRDRQDLALGDTVRVYARVRPLHGELGDQMQLEGVSATASSYADDVFVMAHGNPLFSWAAQWRNSFVESAEGEMPPRQAAVVDALVFGVSGHVSPGDRRELMATGAVHILSASGLQVFLLAFVVQWMLSLAPIPRGVQVAVVAAVLLLYAAAVGLHPAVIRAAIVSILALAAYKFRREPDLLSALGLAAILTVLWQPWTIYTPGFQLSYLIVAAFSLYWKPPKASDGRRLADRAASRVWLLARVSVIACLAGLPIVAFHFGQLPLAAPVANLLIGPALPVIVLASLLGWGSGLLWMPLRVGLMKAVVAPLAGWVLLVSDIFGRQAWAVVHVPAFNAYWLAPYYAAFLFMWERTRRTK